MATLSTQLKTGDGRAVTVGDVAQLYREEAGNIVPLSGQIQRVNDNDYGLTVQFSAVDCDNLERLKVNKVYSLTTALTSKSSGRPDRYVSSVRCVADVRGVTELAYAASANGRFVARLRASSKNTSNDDDAQSLEIWDRSKLLKTINIADLEAHGPIVTAHTFASFVWSKTGEQDKLLYVCKPKATKPTTFFKDSKDSNSSVTDEHLKKDTWGCCLDDVSHTVVAILDVANNLGIKVIDLQDSSLAQPSWADSDTKIVASAYAELPRRYGIVHCNNRSSKIVVIDWASSSTKPTLVAELKDEKESYHEPRVGPSGSLIVFLSNPQFGLHKHACNVNIYDLKTSSMRRLCDSMSKRSEFFIDSLSANCFTSNEEHVLVQEYDHLFDHLILLSVREDSKITKINFPASAVQLVAFEHDLILATGFEINATPTLFVASLNSNNVNDVVAWHQIEGVVHHAEVDSETYQIPTPDDPSSFISAILIKPDLQQLHQYYPNREAASKLITNEKHLPTVVFLHGGPHSSLRVRYYPNFVLYCRLGIKVLVLNYRGSTGVSEKYAQALAGRIGDVDVNDCLLGIRYFAKNELIDPNKLIVMGGSHGGFLSCHLSCQSEFKFRSAVIGNPVVDVSSMYQLTDIPDWTMTEALGDKSHDPTRHPDVDKLTRMFSVSPIAKFERADVPTLMMLGGKDLRVPYYQGRTWYELLKARGVDTLCKFYEKDRHALDRPETMADRTITSVIWMLQHL